MKTHFTKKLAAWVVTGMLLVTTLHAQIDSVLAAQLQQILNNRVQFNGNHGVSACVIMPNGDLWKGTAGVGAGNIAMTDTTVFHGASTTKTNIATLIFLLAEDGLLDLDSSWNKYVSLNVNFDTTITIRQLISNTSGIADYLEVPGTLGYVTTDFNRAFTPVEILEDIVSATPDFAPGTDFGYSTSNFVLAALIAETVTGNPVQQELHNRIWGPLGMTHTYFGGFEAYTEPRAGAWWDFGNGMTNYSNDPETSMLTYGYGGANIVSTPEDLAHFARALFTDTLLSPASLAAMQIFSPQSYGTWCAGYGLGIHNASAFGTNSVLGHDGYYTNMTDMFHSYDYGFTLVTMTNTATQWFGIFNQMYNAIKTNITVGIAEDVATPSVQLFPNPASDRLTIDLGSVQENVAITLVDMAGKAISTATATDMQTLEIATRDFPVGVYIVEIQATDFVAREKLVVTH